MRIMGGGGKEDEGLNCEAEERVDDALANLEIKRETVLASTEPGSISSRPWRGSVLVEYTPLSSSSSSSLFKAS